tara:strand:+ start:47 stop:604 length:558 start_codon:yes stop_codon:yes gene_type:complete
MVGRLSGSPEAAASLGEGVLVGDDGLVTAEWPELFLFDRGLSSVQLSAIGPIAGLKTRSRVHPASLAAMLALGTCSFRSDWNPLPDKMSGIMVKLELDAYRWMPDHPHGAGPPRLTSAPKPIGDFAGDHDARFHHHVIAAGVDMTVEPGTTTKCGPIGISAVFAYVETEGAHVFRPMGVWVPRLR